MALGIVVLLATQGRRKVDRDEHPGYDHATYASPTDHTAFSAICRNPLGRYSFIVMLGAVVFLGHQAAIGDINVQLGNPRGVFNAAWVGTVMAIIASFFLGWFGFCLVKGSVARDRETGNSPRRFLGIDIY